MSQYYEFQCTNCGWIEKRYSNCSRCRHCGMTIKRIRIPTKDEQFSTLQSHVSNLLAVIHRDGGHYESKHGTEKAVEDALKIIPTITASRDAWKKLAEELGQHSTFYDFYGSGNPNEQGWHYKCVHCDTFGHTEVTHSPDCPIEQLRKLKEEENG